jgi:hypothetical protein
MAQRSQASISSAPGRGGRRDRSNHVPAPGRRAAPLESARRDLVQEFQDRLAPEQVSSRFDAIVDEFDGAPVRTFIPVLARRRARRELATSA